MPDAAGSSAARGDDARLPDPDPTAAHPEMAEVRSVVTLLLPLTRAIIAHRRTVLAVRARCPQGDLAHASADDVEAIELWLQAVAAARDEYARTSVYLGLDPRHHRNLLGSAMEIGLFVSDYTTDIDPDVDVSDVWRSYLTRTV